MNIATSKTKLSKLTIVCKYYNLNKKIKQVVFADEKFTNIANPLNLKYSSAKISKGKYLSAKIYRQ